MTLNFRVPPDQLEDLLTDCIAKDPIVGHLYKLYMAIDYLQDEGWIGLYMKDVKANLPNDPNARDQTEDYLDRIRFNHNDLMQALKSIGFKDVNKNERIMRFAYAYEFIRDTKRKTSANS
jgi:hypothetical protein